LYAPAGTASCSVAGVAFTVEDGAVDVPEEAVEVLASHGFATSPGGAKAPDAVTPEAFAEMAQKLTAAKVEVEQLHGSVEAARSERDQALAKVSELEKQLAAGKKR
jgi:formiminotetrahydrofolate cyclodeaminase